jgi:malate permease and related proteins
MIINPEITTVVAKVLPIIIIIALGNGIRVKSILRPETVDELKGLVVNIALPAVLFVAFLDMQMERTFIGLFATIALICIGLLAYGFLLRRLFSIPRDYFPHLTTGFEFGMLGVTLFGTAYGMANVGYIAIVDLSHELFIWFVLATMLTAKRDGAGSLTETLKGFLSSPLIIAIVSATVLNLLGWGPAIRASVLGGAVVETFELIGGLLIPAILIVIGYGMRLSRKGLRDAAGVILARAVVLVPVAIFVSRVVIRRLLQLDPAFEAAVITFLILPPPYIVPLFMRADQKEDRIYANNVLSVYTVVSLAVFVVYFSLNPVL